MSDQHAVHRSGIERLFRRVLNMVGRGAVTTGNDSGLVQLLQVQLSARETHDNVPRLAEYGFTSLPLAGAQHVTIFIGGDRSNGVVVATGDTRYRVEMQPGEACIYDNRGQVVHLTQSGIVIDGASNPINITTGGDCIVTAGGTVQLGAAGGKKIVLDGDPVIGGGGGTVQASSTKVKGT